MSQFTIIDFEEFVDRFAGENVSRKADDAVEMDLQEFNASLLDDVEQEGAQWVGLDEFRTVYKYMRKFNHTYKSVACEIRLTIDPVMDDAYLQEKERILIQCGEIIRKSLRGSDIIMQNENQFYLLLSDLKEADKVSVLNRIRKPLL